jgi:hypothetical protein
LLVKVLVFFVVGLSGRAVALRQPDQPSIFLRTGTVYFQAVSQNFAQRTFIERGDVQQIGATSQRNCLKWKRNDNFRGS